MKVVQVMPRARARLYDTLVDRQAAIQANQRGTFVRAGAKRRNAANWKHKKYRGAVKLARENGEGVTAKIRSSAAEDERQLLKSFLNFVDRYSGDRVSTITIRYH
jgi:hypothetical protein